MTIWRINQFGGLAGTARTEITNGRGSSEARVCKNLIPDRKKGLLRRPGMVRKAIFALPDIPGGAASTLAVDNTSGDYTHQLAKGTTSGIYYYAAGVYGVWKTEDSGANWTQVSTTRMSCVSFTDDLNGWGCYRYKLYQTEDGGQTWTIASLTEFIPTILQAVGEVVYLGNTENLTKYADSAFSDLTLPVGFDLTSLYFTDAANGWIVGTCAGWRRVYSTADGGDSWTIGQDDYLDPAPSFFHSCFMASALVGYAGGVYGSVYKTVDGGSSWRKIKSESSAALITRAIYFLDDDTGFIAVDNASSSCKLYKTTDGGENWEEITLSSFSFYWVFINGIYFSDANTGYIAGGGVAYSGADPVLQMHKTVDGGENWADLSSGFSGSPSFISAISFVDANTGWVAEGLNIQFTSDGGSNFSVQKTGSALSPYFMSISSLDANNAWACSRDGKIWQTTDGGANWNQIDTASGAAYSINMIDSSNGFCCGTGWWGKITSGVFTETALFGTQRVIVALGPSAFLMAGSHIYSTIDAVTVVSVEQNAGVVTLDSGIGLINGVNLLAFPSNDYGSLDFSLVVGAVEAEPDYSFRAVRGGTYVYPLEKWAIGGIPGNGSNENALYEVPEGETAAAVNQGDNFAPIRLGVANVANTLQFYAGLALIRGVHQSGSSWVWYDQAKTPQWKMGFDRLGTSFQAVSDLLTSDGGDYRTVLMVNDTYVGVGGKATAPIAAIAKARDEGALILKEDGGVWVYYGGDAEYSLRQVAALLGRAIPYSMVYATGVVLFSTVDDSFLWSGGEPRKITSMFDSREKLLADFDLDYINRACGGYDPINNAYWLTYYDGTNWKTKACFLDHLFWTEFENALFNEGSFFNKDRNFYLSLDGYTDSLGVAQAPGLYLLDGTGADPDGKISCEYETGDIIDPHSQEMQRALRTVYLVGKGWESCTLSYQDLTGNWHEEDPLTLSDSEGPVHKISPVGGLFGRAFRVNLKADVDDGDELELQEIVLEIDDKRRG